MQHLCLFAQNNQISAFPGAEGFGRYASGGRGGQVIKVTNLNDSGPGSLREALLKKGPRIIVFEVSGNIQLQSPIRLGAGNSDLTIAGQTAPGEGITIADHRITFHNVKNLIVRFIRFRPGDVSGEENQAGYGIYMENAIFDHSTFSWATDEIASFYAVKNFTMQWCIMSEALDRSVHSKGPHGYGTIAGGKNVSWHHNLLAHATQRMTMFDHPGLYQDDLSKIQVWRDVTDFRNNVIYNWRDRSTSNGAEGKFNMINNYFKPGPSTSSFSRNFILNPTNTGNGNSYGYGKFYLNGNFLEGNSQVSQDNWKGARLENIDLTEKFLESVKVFSPFPISDGIYEKEFTPQEAYERVLAHAGASLFRDPVDSRVIEETRTGTYTFEGSKGSTGGIIDSQNDVGGWPQLKSLPAPKDTDRDGMPDEWEIKHGLDPNKADDSLFSLSQDYTNIEVYVNSLVAHISELEPSSPIEVLGISIDPKNASVEIGSNLQLKAAITPSNATNKSVIWTSSKPEIATVNSSGLVSGVTLGTTTITSKTQDGGFTASSTITVNEPANSLTIESFTLVDGGNNTEIQPLTQGDKLDYDQVKNIYLNFRANPNNFEVRSVSISLEGPVNSSRTDNGFTFDLLNNAGLILPLGNYKLSAIPYSEQNNGGVKGKETSIEFSIIESLEEESWQINSFTLIDAYDNSEKFEISDGMKIDTEMIQHLSLNIRANTLPATVGSVFMSITGPITHSATENVAPYSLFGDNNGNYSGRTFPVGDYTLEAIPYAKTNKGGTEGGSISIKFSVIKTEEKTVPEKPILVTPLDKSSDLSNIIDFQWNKVEDATSYQIQLSEKSDFSTVSLNKDDLEANQIQISDLKSGIPYYWRIRASNEVGYSIWSETWSFTTKEKKLAPSTPILLGPENLSSGLTGTITLKWSKPENAEVYRVQIAKDAEFTRMQFDLYNIPTESFDINNMEAGTTFFWRVNASNEGGNSAFSETWKFETLKGPDAPKLISPVNRKSDLGTNVKLEWENVLGADSYRVQVSLTRDFSQRIVDHGNLREPNFNLEKLEEAKTYFWRVRASNKAGTSIYSEVWDFSTKISISVPSIPILISPIQSAVVKSASIDFEWEPSNNAEKYQIQVSKFSNFSQAIVYNNAVTNHKTTVKDLEPDQVYFWRVRAINVAGSSPYSVIWLFKTEPLPNLDKPILINPSNGSIFDTTSVVFKWEEVTDAENYQLEVSQDSTFKSNPIKFPNLVKTDLILDSLEWGQKYYWRVTAHGKRPTSQSEIRKFGIKDDKKITLARLAPIQIKTYPNPFNDQLHLEFSKTIEGEVTISIIDINGITVFEALVKDFKESITLEMPLGLSKGMYFLRVQGFGLLESQKIIKD